MGTEMCPFFFLCVKIYKVKESKGKRFYEG